MRHASVMYEMLEDCLAILFDGGYILSEMKSRLSADFSFVLT